MPAGGNTLHSHPLQYRKLYKLSPWSEPVVLFWSIHKSWSPVQGLYAKFKVNRWVSLPLNIQWSLNCDPHQILHSPEIKYPGMPGTDRFLICQVQVPDMPGSGFWYARYKFLICQVQVPDMPGTGSWYARYRFLICQVQVPDTVWSWPENISLILMLTPQADLTLSPWSGLVSFLTLLLVWVTFWRYWEWRVK